MTGPVKGLRAVAVLLLISAALTVLTGCVGGGRTGVTTTAPVQTESVSGHTTSSADDTTPSAAGTTAAEVTTAAAAQSLISLISYNIAYYDASVSTSMQVRYNGQTADDYTIKKRAARLNALVEHYSPDIICLQEVNNLWWKPLVVNSSSLVAAGYAYVGNCSAFGNSDGKGTPPNELYNLIFYKPEVLELTDSGMFWLSSSPDMPAVSKNANLDRICTWARLRELSSGKELFVASTHLCTTGTAELGKTNTTEAKYLLENTAKLAGELPVIIAGDFNMSESSANAADTYKYIIGEGYSDAQNSAKSSFKAGTVISWGAALDNWQSRAAIDHIFYKGGELTFTKYTVLYDTFDKDNKICTYISGVGANYDISDHFGMYAKIRLG